MKHMLKSKPSSLSLERKVPHSCGVDQEPLSRGGRGPTHGVSGRQAASTVPWCSLELTRLMWLLDTGPLM